MFSKLCLFVLSVSLRNQSQTWLGLNFILPQPMNELWSKGWNEQTLIAHMSLFSYKCSENWGCEEKKCSEVIMVDNKFSLLLLLTIAMSSKYLYCRSFWVAQIEISQKVIFFLCIFSSIRNKIHLLKMQNDMYIKIKWDLSLKHMKYSVYHFCFV